MATTERAAAAGTPEYVLGLIPFAAKLADRPPSMSRSRPLRVAAGGFATVSGETTDDEFRDLLLRTLRPGWTAGSGAEETIHGRGSPRGRGGWLAFALASASAMRRFV